MNRGHKSRVNKITSLSESLARYLSEKKLRGSVVVVAEEPRLLLHEMEKKWKKLIHKSVIEMKHEPDELMRLLLKGKVARMSKFYFTTEHEQPGQNSIVVHFIGPGDLGRPNIISNTFYITCSIAGEAATALSGFSSEVEVIIYNGVMMPVLEK